MTQAHYNEALVSLEAPRYARGTLAESQSGYRLGQTFIDMVEHEPRFGPVVARMRRVLLNAGSMALRQLPAPSQRLGWLAGPLCTSDDVLRWTAVVRRQAQ